MAKLTKTIKAIKTVGEEVVEGVFMADCGCEVEGTQVTLCGLHKKMSDTKAAQSIMTPVADIEETEEAAPVQEEQPSIELTVDEETNTTTKEEETMTTEQQTKKPTKFQLLKLEAAELGINPKGLNSIAKVQAAIDAVKNEETGATTVEEPAKEVVEEAAEPVAIELDYNQAINDYATVLLKAVSAGVDYKTLAVRASYAAHGILAAQVAQGVELTDDQLATMERHGAKYIKREQLISFTTIKELTNMSGTQLYSLAIKLGAKPKLDDIEALRTNLINYYKANVVARPKQQPQQQPQQASAASNNNAFQSARAICVYPNAIQFVANGEEYVFGFNADGKGILKKGNNVKFMDVKYLKGLLFPINTKSSRELVRLLGTLKAQPQVKGAASEASAKEKNSAAKNNSASTITIKGIEIDKAWFNKYVDDKAMTKKHGSKKMSAEVIIAEYTK